MSPELTSRFLRKLRMVELVTALFILAMLSFVLIAWGHDESSSDAGVAAIHRSAQTAVGSHGSSGPATSGRAS